MALLSLVLAHLLSGVAAVNFREEPFIGWEGESYKPMEPQIPPKDPKAKWVEVVSWKPRTFIYHNFMTEEETRHIRHVAAPMMRRSTVVGAHGSSVLDDYRTSYGTFIKRQYDPVIGSIEQRVAAWARMDPVHAEDMQVLRYGVGQQYKVHMDTLDDEVAGPRVATVLLYLNDVEEGGETAFTKTSFWSHPTLHERYDPALSACAKGHVAFRPKRGDALMFWSIKPDGQNEDPHSMHSGCPVVRGVKWTATKWIHARPFRPATFAAPEARDPDPGLCVDAEDRCAEWAAGGECTRNRGFMVGDASAGGKCRLSCKVCTPCVEGDRACYMENRRRAGYLIYDEKELL